MQAIQRAVLAALLVISAGLPAAADEVPWAPSLDQALAQAARDNRLVLIHFWSTNCAPCLRMDRFVFSQPDVAQAIVKDYVPVKIDAMRERDIALRYHVNEWPTDVIVAPDGTKLASFSGERKAYDYKVKLAQSIQNYRLRMPGVAAAPPREAPPNQTSYNQQTQFTQPPAGGQNAYGGNSSLPYNGYQAGAGNGFSPPGGNWNSNPNPNGYNPYPGNQPGNYQPPGNPNVGNPYGQAPTHYDTATRQYQPQNPRYTPDGSAGRFPSPMPPPGVGNTAPTGDRWNPQPNNGGGSFAGGPPPNPSQMIVNDRYTMPPAQPGGGPPPQQQGSFQPQPQPNRPPAAPQPPAVPDNAPIAVDGHCVVTLVQAQQWAKGDPRWGAVHRGRTYLFAGQQQQQQFLANPDYFSPVLSGYDPVVFAETGQLVEGQRKHGLFYGKSDSQVYLFADEASLKRFWIAPQQYADTARQAMYGGTVNRR